MSTLHNSIDFQDDVVVVVGAASGIGRATSSVFENAGARVVRVDLAEIGGENSHKVDATDFQGLQRLAAGVQDEFGRVDHAVVSIGKCSGTFGFPFWNVDPAEWAGVLDVNLVAPVNVAHAFVPFMLSAKRGTICFVASVAGQIGSQTDPPYSAAKAGLINFTQCAARDLAPYGIRVNAVSPGMVKTPMNRRVWQAWRGQFPGEPVGLRFVGRTEDSAGCSIGAMAN